MNIELKDLICQFSVLLAEAMAAAPATEYEEPEGGGELTQAQER